MSSVNWLMNLSISRTIQMSSSFNRVNLYDLKGMIRIDLTKSHKKMNQKSNVDYDDFAETFGQSRRGMHWREIDEILTQFIETCSPESAKIADIGCGNGRLLTHIMQHPRAVDFQKFTTYV